VRSERDIKNPKEKLTKQNTVWTPDTFVFNCCNKINNYSAAWSK
jgi:hypothetical protein